VPCGTGRIIAEIRARQPEAKILLFDAPRAGWTDADANTQAHAGIVDNQTVFYAGLGERFMTDRDGDKAWAAALEPWLERFGLKPAEPVRTGTADRTPAVAPPTPGSSTTQPAVSGRFVIRGVRLFAAKASASAARWFETSWRSGSAVSRQVGDAMTKSPMI
jgi:hypothetical protein